MVRWCQRLVRAALGLRFDPPPALAVVWVLAMAGTLLGVVTTFSLACYLAIAYR